MQKGLQEEVSGEKGKLKVILENLKHILHKLSQFFKQNNHIT